MVLPSLRRLVLQMHPMSELAIKSRTGPPVEGNDFYGRQNELNYVWERLEGGNHIILPSPRRVGKSSFAKRLLAIAKSQGWDTLEMNLEQVHSELEFIALFLDKLKEQSWWESAKDKVNKILGHVKSLKPTVKYGDVEVSMEWNARKANVYQQISSLLEHRGNSLIFFDEFAVLLNSMVKQENGKADVENFLHWLRSLTTTTSHRECLFA